MPRNFRPSGPRPSGHRPNIPIARPIDEATYQDILGNDEVLAQLGIRPGSGQDQGAAQGQGSGATQGPAAGTGGAGATDAPSLHRPEGGVPRTVYDEHAALAPNLSYNLTKDQKAELEQFAANYETNKARYDAVAKKTGIPSTLVAAIHWRESTGDFTTYLHQGDPLGKQAVNEPNDIPIFYEWEEAAVHALTMPDKAAISEELSMTENTRDPAAIATFAEHYNGLGYHKYHSETESPYVYGGTDAYQRGKYVSDGKWSATHKDQQLGVMVMVERLGGADLDIQEDTDGSRGWARVLAGTLTLKRGSKVPAVKALQRKLGEAGFPCGDDGDFGPTVQKTVQQFQKSKKLKQTGVVTKELAAVIDAG
jgi:lysozyme family protein